MRNIASLVVLASLFHASNLLGECPSAGQVKRKWDLWAHGTCLRGANIWQKRIEPDYDGDSLGDGHIGPPFIQSDFDRLAALGANYVNASVPGVFTERGNYELDAAALEALDTNIERAGRAGLFIVISFRTGPGRNEAGFDSSEKERSLHDVWKSQAAQDAWVKMWAFVAERYASVPHVAGYDLMVEPNANEVWLQEWDPQTFYKNHQNTLYDWNPFASRMADAIRAVDSQTPILVGAMNYSDLHWLGHLKPLAHPFTVQTIHHYAPYQYTHQAARLTYPGTFDADENGAVETVDAVWLDRLLEPVDAAKAKGRTVGVNEFGVMRWARGAERYFQDTVHSLEKRGANHALWLWEPQFRLGYDHFDFRKGPSKSNHTDVSSSALLTTIKAVWSKNRLRPGQVRFKKKN